MSVSKGTPERRCAQAPASGRVLRRDSHFLERVRSFLQVLECWLSDPVGSGRHRGVLEQRSKRDSFSAGGLCRSPKHWWGESWQTLDLVGGNSTSSAHLRISLIDRHLCNELPLDVAVHVCLNPSSPRLSSPPPGRQLSSEDAVKRVLAGEKGDVKGRASLTSRPQEADSRHAREEEPRVPKEKEVIMR